MFTAALYQSFIIRDRNIFNIIEIMFPTIPFTHLSKKFSVITIFGQKMFLHVDNQQSRFLWDNLNLRQCSSIP